MAGIASGTWFPGRNALAYLAIIISSAFIFHGIKKEKTAFVLPIVLFAALGYLSVQPWVSPKFPSNHIVRFTDTHRWKIIGEVDKRPTAHGNRFRFILKTESLGANDVCFPVTGKIRVTVTGTRLKIFAGDRISIFSKLRSIRNFNNPGRFDYERYMAFKRIRASAYVPENRVTLLDRNSGKGIRLIAEEARSRISNFIEQNGQGEQKQVLKALIVGDRSGISPHLREAFNRSGTGHLLAISGLHIGIVATVAFIFFRWMLSHVEPFLWLAWTRKGAAILSLLPVLAYGLIAGMSPSTQRAVIMVLVFMMAFLLEREHDPINTLALAAMLILGIYPPSLFSISFQLSFTAVFSILYGLSRTRPGQVIKRKGSKFWGKLFSFFRVSFFAILGTMPLIAYYFNQVSMVGLLANFVIVPIIGFIVVPLGLFSVFLYPISLSGASWCIRGSGLVLETALDIVYFFSDLPFAAVKTVTPTYFEICCYYVLAWAVLHMIRDLPKATGMKARISEPGAAGIAPGRENRARGDMPVLGSPEGRSGRLWQRFRVATFSRRRRAAIVAVIVFLAGCGDAVYWLNKRFWHDDLRATVVDVGQGGSILLEFPNGYCLLIDGGGFSDNSVFDVGKMIVAPLLWRKKIKTVDTLVLSHPNSDHLNGLLYIARHFNVKSIWTNSDTADTISYRNFLDIIEDANIPVPKFKDISRRRNINGVTFKILYPPRDFMEKREKEKWRTINNSSLVIKVEFGSVSFLFPGDIKARAEAELVESAGGELRSTVLIAPHHGSKSSSTARFLNRVNPDFAIISSGWKNRFKFPHPSVLKRYRKQGCRILRTDRDGAITISTDGRSVDIKTTMEGTSH